MRESWYSLLFFFYSLISFKTALQPCSEQCHIAASLAHRTVMFKFQVHLSYHHWLVLRRTNSQIDSQFALNSGHKARALQTGV